ncbi:MAG TPA: cytochrome c oxidase subunit II [Planctomycetaceae bacterium]|jgi:cytochrome c oxidase subunit 2|nr:cytochrome c oxidase subunit II [Planctomycetaceae bacterium]
MFESAKSAWFPPEASTTAAHVDHLLYFLLTVCGSVGLLVAFLMFYFCIKYRRRPGAGRPARTHASHALEWFWTITPLFIFVGIFIWGAVVYVDAYHAPADSIPIYGIGKQWMWKFQHPEGQREINTLHVPLGRPVQVLLTSEDVIHSFFIPAFRVHMDVLPNRYTSVWFQATRPGEYHLFCSQYCGTNHAGMIGTVVVMEPADFENWLSLHAEGSLALEGRKVFLKYRCVSCHSANAGARAPVLEGLYGNTVRLNNGRTVIADDAYIRESILDPGAKIAAGWENIMPTFRGQITEEEIYALIAYFRSLQRGQTPRRVEDYPPPTGTPPINTKTPEGGTSDGKASVPKQP